MSFELIKRLAVFFILCVVQILFLNHIRLFGVATPMLYILFVIIFHRNTPKWALLLWSFALGLAIDVFSKVTDLSVSQDVIHEALSSVVTLTGLRGRWEVIQTSPFVVCDTGHNLAAWEYLNGVL